MKNILRQFNEKETVLVLTSYPNPAGGRYGPRNFNAVGWHSERLLASLSKKRKVLVLAENALGARKSFSVNENLFVRRSWKKGNLFSFLSLLLFMLRQFRAKSVLVQFEFNVFGGTLPNLMLLFMLFVLKACGKHVTFELHQVITDVGKLEKHVHITNFFAKQFFNKGLMLYYFLLGHAAQDIIVFEEELKTRLSRFVNPNQITVLSIAVEKKTPLEKEAARKKAHIKTNEFVLLVFGFINGYKGIDWIIEALKGIKKEQKIRLLIVGGANPYLKDKAYYKAFYKSILTAAKKKRHITHVDFVPDSAIETYFSACDTVIMPYEVFMSASGPFSHAISYGKPILLSETLLDYSNSHDFVKALHAARLKRSDIFFPMTSEALLTRVVKLQTKKAYYKRFETFSETLGTLRSMESVTKRLNTMLFTSPSPSLSKGKAAFAKSY